MLISRPPTENEAIARSVCQELSDIKDDNRNEIIRISANKIITEIVQEGNSRLANALREELTKCYPKLFPKDNLVTA